MKEDGVHIVDMDKIHCPACGDDDPNFRWLGSATFSIPMSSLAFFDPSKHWDMPSHGVNVGSSWGSDIDDFDPQGDGSYITCTACDEEWELPVFKELMKQYVELKEFLEDRDVPTQTTQGESE